MVWRLSEAVLRCQARRLRGLFLRSPLVACAVLAAFVSAPYAAARAGAAAAAPVATTLGSSGAARLLVLSLVLPALAAGAAVGPTIPFPSALGAQLACAPVSRAALASVAALPTWLAVIALTPLVTAAIFPLVAAGPGGAPSAVAILAVLPVAAAAGALTSELAIGSLRGSRRAALALLALCAVAGGVTALGWPVDVAADAVAGRAGALVPTLSALAAAVLLGVLWLVARSRRGEHLPNRRRVAGPPVPVFAAPLLAQALIVLARRRDTRGALTAAAAFGLAGVAVGTLVGLAPAPLFALGLSSVIASGVLVPLAAAGAASGCRWLLATCPRAPLALAAAWSASAAALLALAAAPLLAVSALTGGLPAGAIETTCSGVALAAGSGVLAGAVVPWRPAGVGDQLAALGALAGCGAAAVGASVAAVEWGGRIGLGDAAASGLVALLVVLAGVGACARRLGRES